MREIKFRAWDMRNNKMHIDFMSHVELCTAEGFGNPWRDNQYIPMQYTGLKDKNGKEIYEGDIVCTERGLSEVRFNHGMFVLKYEGISNMKPVCRGGAEAIETIGNIYSNPELLTN